jgi:hypothetical protein
MGFDCELREVLFYRFVSAFHLYVVPGTTSASQRLLSRIVFLPGLIREL